MRQAQTPRLPATVRERARPVGPGDGFYRRAVRAAVAGDLVAAKRLYEACLAAEPAHVEACHDLGVLALREGRRHVAMRHFRGVTAIHASHAGAWLNISLILCDQGDGVAARAAAETAVSLAPRSAMAHAALGHASSLLSDLDGAAAAYRRSLAIDGEAASVVARYADVLMRMGRRDASLVQYDRRLALQPRDLKAHAERLSALVSCGRAGEADVQRRALAALVASRPDDLGVLCEDYLQADRAADALALLDVVMVGPLDQAGHLAARADVFHRLGRMGEALADLKAALALDPSDIRVLFTIGRFFQSFGQPAAAAPFFLQVVQADPDNLEALIQLAAVKLACNDASSAIPLLRHALTRLPDRHDLLAQLCWCRMNACDWVGLQDDFHRSLALHINAGEPFPTFSLFAFGLPNAEFQLWSRAWAERHVGSVSELPMIDAGSAGAVAADRIRIGYLSADYAGHATAVLLAELLEMHDRRRFEVFGYNIGSLDSSALGQRMTGSVDHFVDLSGVKDRDAARRIAADRIDILVDLKGYTKDSRPEILSHRPSAIQVNYLGYPATMGTPAIDYIIADAIVIPVEHRDFYDEAVVHLPNCYQPNDRQRPGPDPAQTRARQGLPPTGFVFCCFNNNYKITPLVFSLWMKLLLDVPGSVLWLLMTDSQIERNLRREAVDRGVSPERLVFAPRVSFVDHIGRLALADLFLDTLPVNAHTTASEALWCGVPVLTCLGPHFVGRVAASLLTAVGLPEMITTSLADYEREALALARDPARLGALRAKLAGNRDTAPLFDTPRYVAGYEAALERMVEMRDAGRRPEAFALLENDRLRSPSGSFLA